MCEPVTAAIASMSASTMMAASLAVTAVSTGVNYWSQAQQAEAQVEAQEQNALNMRNAAVENMVRQSGDLQQREMQEREAAGHQLFTGRIKAKQAAATANATSQSAGLSVDALMADYNRQYARYSDTTLRQLGYNVDQLARTREGIEAQTRSRINSTPLNPVSRPSIGMALGEFGASALNSYNRYSVVDPLTGRRTLT